MSEKQRSRIGNQSPFPVTRRQFLTGSIASGAVVPLRGGSFVSATGEVALDPLMEGDDSFDAIDLPTTPEPRHWLGPHFWGNRLQDWQLADGRLECLRGEAGYELRTVGLLTREIVSGTNPGYLRVRTGVLDGAAEPGFCGFLLGVGAGELDYRAAALAQRSSGGGGGLLCTFETDGQVRFRDHTDEENPITYEALEADETTTGETPTEVTAETSIRLEVDIVPEAGGDVTLSVGAFDADTDALVSSATLRGVSEEMLLGGISLVSSPEPGVDGPRWWFDELRTAGRKISTQPDRTFGPIAGTLYSVNESVLKLSAQLLPVGDSGSEQVELRYRPSDSTETWQTSSTTLDRGYTALFRIEEWDPTRAWDYRVVYTDSTETEWRYEGQIAADPDDSEELTIGLVGCTIACARQLDRPTPRSEYPQKSVPPRYSSGNIYFPYERLTENLERHDPDLLVATGDQFYEASPTKVEDREDPGLDYLYKWYLWLWAFGDLTRTTPTITLVDDHDVFQPDLWGARGKKTTYEDLHAGGYVGASDFVNRVIRTQCRHNPDPYDPTPIKRGISVYYSTFIYGATSFGLLESRTFKLGPEVNRRRYPEDRVLLGERQHRFLEEWANRNQELPKLCVTQTIFSSVRTTKDGKPFFEFETNGYPTKKRDRALETLRDAGALMLAGDQHLASLVRHGIDDAADGVVQFTGPAGGTLYQRWFVPDADDATNLEEAVDSEEAPNLEEITNPEDANTGTFEDTHGNAFRALAVANPKLSATKALEERGTNTVFDRELKREGYGIVRVNHDEEVFVIECWPRTADPMDEDAEQFPGWPYRLPFEEADGRD